MILPYLPKYSGAVWAAFLLQYFFWAIHHKFLGYFNNKLDNVLCGTMLHVIATN